MADLDPTKLRLATDGELTESLMFALMFKGRKRVHHAADFMARIAAENLIDHLRTSGYVVMKGPPETGPSAHSRHMRPKE